MFVTSTPEKALPMLFHGIEKAFLHLFRSYVVNTGLRKGATLEQMARYMGHESIHTTAKYYWTEEVTHQIALLLDGATPGSLVDIQEQIEATQQEIRKLELILSEKKKDSSRKRVTVIVGKGVDEFDPDKIMENLLDA